MQVVRDEAPGDTLGALILDELSGLAAVFRPCRRLQPGRGNTNQGSKKRMEKSFIDQSQHLLPFASLCFINGDACRHLV